MWNSSYLLIPSFAYLINQNYPQIKEVMTPNICNTNLITAIHNIINVEIYNEIHRILSSDSVNKLLDCIIDTKCNIEYSKLNIKYFKINILLLKDWQEETNIKNKDEIFKNIVNQLSATITKTLNIPNDEYIKNHINKYLSDVYINIIDNYNKNIITTKSFNTKDKNQLKYCSIMLTTLYELYPKLNNLNNINSITNVNKNQLEVALSSLNNKILHKKCDSVSYINNKNLEHNLVQKLNKLSSLKSNRLDNLNINVNANYRRKKISDLTLKELINNTSSTVLLFINNINNFNNLDNIKMFLLKNDNIFYIGVFLIVFSFILYFISQ